MMKTTCMWELLLEFSSCLLVLSQNRLRGVMVVLECSGGVDAGHELE